MSHSENAIKKALEKPMKEVIIMVRDFAHVNVNPHMDGSKEGIIKDADGDQMGISAQTDKDKTPFHVTTLKKDPELQTFSDMFERDR